MHDLCERYGFKVLAYGTLVSTSLRLTPRPASPTHVATAAVVRGPPDGPVAWETGARAVLGPTQSFPEKGEAPSDVAANTLATACCAHTPPRDSISI